MLVQSLYAISFKLHNDFEIDNIIAIRSDEEIDFACV